MTTLFNCLFKSVKTNLVVHFLEQGRESRSTEIARATGHALADIAERGQVRLASRLEPDLAQHFSASKMEILSVII